MKKVLKLLPLMLGVIMLSSCLSSGIEIEVNKDGSGQIIQTFHVQKEYMAFMNLGEETTDPNMINRQELGNRARDMGEGVTFSKVEPAPEASPFAGYKAFFTFTDIRKIRTTATPMTTPGETVDASEWITFDFKKGNTSTLTIISASDDEDYDEQDEYSDSDSESSEEVDESMQEQLKQIYSTMHFWFKVRVKGNISNTNARYSTNNEIALMDMSFEKIVENDDVFSHITSDSNSDLDEIREDLERIGVKVDDQEKIDITFR